MIYEVALVASASTDDAKANSLNEMVMNTIRNHKGEVLVQDDWGVRFFAQTTSSGVDRGRYLYFLYKCEDGDCNAELTRLFRINESLVKHICVKLGENRHQEQIVKAYKSPYSKRYNSAAGDNRSRDDEEEGERENSRDRKFSKKKSCWFTANNLCADWKDPNTFSWLINEFGKISPGRVSGISRKHQRVATIAIKRARQMGIASYVTNKIAN